jgi:RNA polymerase sigma factor (TIGR02999 family)
MPSLATPDTSITQLLNSWSQGQDQALDRLIPLVYADLRRMARRHMRGERDDHVLQSTALVHEAFMRLGEQRGVEWSSRGQFYGWMSTLMRRILVDHARSRNAAKRGQGACDQSLDAMREESGDEETQACPSGDQWLSLLQLDRALVQLEGLDARQGRVVELRFFGGLTVEQTAQAMGISEATVKREWSTARAWLLRELGH